VDIFYKKKKRGLVASSPPLYKLEHNLNKIYLASLLVHRILDNVLSYLFSPLYDKGVYLDRSSKEALHSTQSLLE